MPEFYGNGKGVWNMKTGQRVDEEGSMFQPKPSIECPTKERGPVKDKIEEVCYRIAMRNSYY